MKIWCLSLVVILLLSTVCECKNRACIKLCKKKNSIFRKGCYKKCLKAARVFETEQEYTEFSDLDWIGLLTKTERDLPVVLKNEQTVSSLQLTLNENAIKSSAQTLLKYNHNLLKTEYMRATSKVPDYSKGTYQSLYKISAKVTEIFGQEHSTSPLTTPEVQAWRSIVLPIIVTLPQLISCREMPTTADEDAVAQRIRIIITYVPKPIKN